MKSSNRQSSNIEDVRGEDPNKTLFKEMNKERGFDTDVLTEPTPIARQRNNEGKKFRPEKNLTIKKNLTDGMKDPSPGFLKHTTKNYLK